MDTKIETVKIELIQWIQSLNNTDILKRLLLLKNQEKNGFDDFTNDEEKISLLKGLSDADEKKLVVHEEAKNIYRKWLS